MANPVISWASNNPLAAGAAALGVLVVVMMVSGGGAEEDEGSSGGLGSAGVAAYYDAVKTQGQAGAAIQIEQIKAQASTNQALIASSYGIEKDKIWAPISAVAQANSYALGLDAQAKNYELQNSMWQSQERIAANQIGANVQIAAHQASVGRAQAKAGQPSGFAQGVNAVSGLVGSVSKVIPFL